jgi:hypothetical protein
MQILNEKLNARAPVSQKNGAATKVVQSEESKLFLQCLRTLQVAIDLLSEADMRRENAIKIITQRLNNIKGTSQADMKETIQILQFLNTYAQPKRGSYHLAEQIFQHLRHNQCI